MQKEVENSLKVLNKEQTLVYPTDTVWGIGCDATNEKAVEKVYKMKHRAESKSLIMLVDSIEMLQKYIPPVTKEILLLLSKTTHPTTIIYNNPHGLAKNAISSDKTVAIRIVQNEFCKELIAAFGKPIVSTSANISGHETPKSFAEINQAILDSADYVVDLQREVVSEKSSTIIKIDENDEIVVLRP